jgi:hypothetical protein
MAGNIAGSSKRFSRGDRARAREAIHCVGEAGAVLQLYKHEPAALRDSPEAW